ncbi:MAG: efflux RND transporter periplasmic adaptor subunit [Phycisphaerales bacterium]|nr:efflux RND transporter periplasmic adaptor subunit [Phycisphaerales bacterium]
MIRWTMIAVMAPASLWGCAETPQPTNETPPVAVTTTTVTSGDFEVKRVYPAIASSPWQVEVVARVDGWLDKRLFDQGDQVEAGQLLFVIQQREYEADVASAEAALQSAVAQAELAEIIVERNAPLVATGAVAAETFDQYEANLAVARASIRTAEAQLVQARLQLEYTEIRAPIAGRIGASSIDPGTYVAPGSTAATLCTIVTTNPIRVNFAPAANEFPEYLSKIVSGGKMAVEVSIPRQDGWKRDGKVSFIDNTANPDTSLIRMWTDLENNGHQLLPGQYCEATVTMSELDDALTIPSKALVQVASDVYVWLVDSNDTVKETKVEVDFIQGEDAVIKSGLRSGDRIVLEGVSKIRFNGTKITEAPPPAPPGTPPPAATSSASSSTSSQ